ncbi:hypothetical protein NEISICOT_00645 [Neisseria sicca ATCC 29256]|uniref:Uncharacterized protein n=1 Tax=Neisseria sicca ATCC 29256 TaxID=547045 RepID=C6M2A6_NEISI|nr:hypothetical protein NEISICOT_00645 [Neisseria sicca ATCC 29256]
MKSKLGSSETRFFPSKFQSLFSLRFRQHFSEYLPENRNRLKLGIMAQ